jgi:hypothetical protein
MAVLVTVRSAASLHEELVYWMQCCPYKAGLRRPRPFIPRRLLENSSNSYVGFKTYTFLFRGEKIVDTRLPLPGYGTKDTGFLP